MIQFQPPLLKDDFVCITSRDVDLELLAKVSCYFNDPNTYFPVFVMPTIDQELEVNCCPKDDGYINYIFVKKTTTLILNCIARIKHKNILLVGLSNLQKSFLDPRKYWKVNFIEIDSFHEIDTKLSFLNKKFNGVLACRNDEIIKGMYVAKKDSQLLTIEDSSHRLVNLIERGGEGLIVLEPKGDVSDIVITNYAISINADIKYLNEIRRNDLHDIISKFNEWKTTGSYGSYLSVSNKVNELMEGIDLRKYNYITFFTDGIPYGYFYNSIIPCSHVMRSISVDLFIMNNIIFELSTKVFGSAIIFSPNPPDLKAITRIESESVGQIFTNNNLYVENLIDKKATVYAFDFYTGYYPYDILHICTHGGEIDGYYVTHEFQDRKGNNHIIEYEEVVGISRIDKDNCGVARKKVFKYFDGHVWMSEDLKKQNYDNFVYKDMEKALYDDERNQKITRTKLDGLIKDSCHIRCYDGIHQGQFHSLASVSSPFIFNNTCNSWQEFSTHLLAGGCRAYIGTLWSIGNETAKDSTNEFYGNPFDSNIINAAQKMNNEIKNDEYKNIYLFCGLHFATLRRSLRFSQNQIMFEIMNSLNMWLEKASNEKSNEILINSIDIIKFLCLKLTPYYYIKDVTALLSKAARICHYLHNDILNSSQ